MKTGLSIELTRLADSSAALVESAFEHYQQQFLAITRRARQRFEACAWLAGQKDALERLELYKTVVDDLVLRIQAQLGDYQKDIPVWMEMKRRYARRIAGREDLELAETFFNSVTRRILATVGVDPQIEFTGGDFDPPQPQDGEIIYHTYTHTHPGQPAVQLIQQILSSSEIPISAEQTAASARLAAEEISTFLQQKWGAPDFKCIEMIRPAFYRGSGAFLVGRICSGDQPAPSGSPVPASELRRRYTPLLFCLANGPDGVFVDAVLLDEDEVSILFSFTRSYFHVEAAKPRQLVAFLKSIIPLKRVAELYISIGYNKHGKTELYRDLMHHLSNSHDQFEIARGERGMVMVVFTLPSYDMVFKVIRDHIEPPKSATRQEVMARYDLVFKHDRAGRLVDAQEFEHLSFARSRFSEDLIAELQSSAPGMISIEADVIAIRHLYTERRLTPLNLYVREAEEAAARLAVIDYGQAIKDLAATNIFPGDVLLKNFGVTRHGRIVFYDYDELALLTDCTFRSIPRASHFDDDFSAEPWFYVGPMDIFPEEFHTFLGLQEPLRTAFIQPHGDLFLESFWREMQARHRRGEVIEIVPYPEHRRVHDAEKHPRN